MGVLSTSVMGIGSRKRYGRVERGIQERLRRRVEWEFSFPRRFNFGPGI